MKWGGVIGLEPALSHYSRIGQKSKTARIFVLLIFAITFYWHTYENNIGLGSAQLKKTDTSILGRCALYQNKNNTWWNKFKGLCQKFCSPRGQGANSSNSFLEHFPRSELLWVFDIYRNVKELLFCSYMVCYCWSSQNLWLNVSQVWSLGKTFNTAYIRLGW